MTTTTNKTSMHLISLGDKFWSRVQLSMLVLKSYLLYHNIHMQLHIRLFDSEGRHSADIAQRIFEENPEIVGFSAHIYTFEKVVEICHHLKQLNPNIIIMIGGGVPTYEARYVMENHGYFDIAVKGQGEKHLHQLLTRMQEGNMDFSDIPNLVYRQNGELIETPASHAFSIENMTYPLLLDDIQNEEFFFVETSRGCMYNCKYCAFNMYLEKKNLIIYYPWEKVEGDLRRVFEMPKIRRISFTDSSIFHEKERGLKLLNLVNELNAERCQKKKAPIDIALAFTLERLNDELLYTLRKTFMGFDGTSLGLQSTDNEVLRRCSRPPFNKERFIKNANILTANGKIPVNTELIFGLPGDTYEKFKNSLEFCLSDIKANAAVCFRLRVIPGSEFWNNKEKYGLVSQEHSPYVLISSPTFPPDQLQKAEILSFTFELIYRIFRSIQRLVDEHCVGRKVDAYEQIANVLVEKYDDFFHPSKLCRHDVYEYMNKLTTTDRELRRQLLVDMRQTVKAFMAEEIEQSSN